MGTWGAGLFSDDLAADVRGDFRELIGDGLSSADATDRLIREYRGSLQDPDEGPVFWLALAATQWQAGQVVETVLKKALEVIDRGADLKRWAHDPTQQKKRKTILEKLRGQLISDPPPPKKLPRVLKAANNWTIGDLAAYRLRSNRYVVFRVIGHHEDKGGRSAVCELLDWVGTDLPPKEDLERLRIKREPNARGTSRFLLGEPKESQTGADRLVRLGLKSKPAQSCGAYTVFPWKFLDQLLAEVFGVA